MRGGNKIRGRTSGIGSVMHISVFPSFVVGMLGVVVRLQVHRVHSPNCVSPRVGLRGDSFLSLSSLCVCSLPVRANVYSALRAGSKNAEIKDRVSTIWTRELEQECNAFLYIQRTIQNQKAGHWRST